MVWKTMDCNNTVQHTLQSKDMKGVLGQDAGPGLVGVFHLGHGIT